MSDSIDPKPKARRWRWLIWVCGASTALVVALCLWGYANIGRTVQLSPWITERLIAQVSAAVPGAEVRFESASVLVEKDLHPTVVFERLDLVPDGDGPVVSFGEVATSLSYRRLMRGQIAPRTIAISGIVMGLRRDEAGAVSLELNSADTGAGATDLRDFEAQIDDLLQTPAFERLTDVSLDAITVQFEDARAARRWTVDGGNFRLTREGKSLRMSSALALLGGRDYISTIEFNFETVLGTRAAQFGVNFEDMPSTDIASQSPALTWLNIIDAPISGAMRLEIDESGDLGPLNAALRVDEGVLQPDGQVRAVPFRNAGTHFTFDPKQNAIIFDELVVDSAWGRARAEGVAQLKQMVGGLPGALWGQFKFTELGGNPAGLFESPIAVDHAQADFRLILEPFSVQVGEFLVQKDQQTVSGDGRLTTRGDKWAVRLNAHMDQIAATDVVKWWPEKAAEKPRTWIAENITAGTLSDVNFVLQTAINERPDIYLDFAFQDAVVRYVKTLPVAEDLVGRAVWTNHRFVVTAEDGVVKPVKGGPIDISGTSFVISDLRQKPAPAEVVVATNGTVTGLLSYLNSKPFEILEKSGLPADLADGEVTTKGRLSLLLKKGLKPEEVSFDIAGTARDVTTRHFVPGKQLVVPELTARATQDSVVVGGRGRLGSLPVEATWSAPLGPENNGKSQVLGSAELSERTVDEFNLGLSQDMLRGQGQAVFRIDIERDQTPKLTVSSDLRGVRFAIPSIAWRKPADQPAEFELKATLDQPFKVDNLRLSARGLDAQGKISMLASGGMDVLSLSRLRVGTWFDGSANLTARAGQPLPSVEVTGGALDLRDLPDLNQASGGARTPLFANLSTLQVTDTIALTDLSGSFLAGGGIEGEFQARVNGGTRVSGALIPANGRAVVRLTSQDAGGVLRSAEFLRNASGGEFQVDLVPIGEADFDGKLQIKNVRIQDAPAFAELLNAISVVGLLDQLGGEGILFNEVESQFRLSPNRVTVTQASAVGPSMGISADGIYSTGNKVFDIQGVISPLYVLNAIGRPIARKGEGLFGFNYSLTGASDSLVVRVNPLSVLTPGIFRNIFRRPPPEPEAESQ